MQRRVALSLFIRNMSEENRIGVIYRCISLLISSSFYFIGNEDHSVGRKLFFITCILISAIVLVYLYRKNDDSPRKTRILVITETIGNSLILIPSGGLASPYIWYALNTMLIASLKLTRVDCWMNLAIYLACSMGVTYYFFGETGIGIVEFIGGESYLVVSFVLIAIAAQLLGGLLKRIEDERRKTDGKNAQLIDANRRIKESMELMMSFYQAVHSFSNHGEDDELGRMLAHHTRIATNSDVAFFCREGCIEHLDSEKFVVVTDGSNEKHLETGLHQMTAEMYGHIVKRGRPVEMVLGNMKFAIVAIGSTHRKYGVLGIRIPWIGDCKSSETCASLKFMAELGSIVFEKAYIENMNSEFLISEEKNRIANEMHDNVLQRLFCVSNGIFSLGKRMEHLNMGEIHKELNVARNSIDSAMKELRRTIYEYSWGMDGTDSFEESLSNYIEDIRIMNNVEITCEISGKCDLLPCRHKMFFYRTVLEVVSNSLHHGEASRISIDFDIDSKTIALRITDNGKGFEVEEIMESHSVGLGIRNIHYLAESLDGKVIIDSKAGVGTTVEMIVPNGLNLH